MYIHTYVHTDTHTDTLTHTFMTSPNPPLPSPSSSWNSVSSRERHPAHGDLAGEPTIESDRWNCIGPCRANEGRTRRGGGGGEGGRDERERRGGGREDMLDDDIRIQAGMYKLVRQFHKEG